MTLALLISSSTSSRYHRTLKEMFRVTPVRSTEVVRRVRGLCNCWSCKLCSNFNKDFFNLAVFGWGENSPKKIDSNTHFWCWCACGEGKGSCLFNWMVIDRMFLVLPTLPYVNKQTHNTRNLHWRLRVLFVENFFQKRIWKGFFNRFTSLYSGIDAVLV